MRNAEKTIINQLAAGVLARDKRDKEEERQLAQLQPDPPPLGILEERLRGRPDSPPLLFPEKTETQRMIEEHYKTNAVRSESGRTAFEPPPVLLAPMKEGN